MHILILGAYCSCNVGDALICRCTEQRLRRAYPEAKITVADFVARDRLAPKAVPGAWMLRRRAAFAAARRRLLSLGVDMITPREEARVEANRAHLEQLCAGDYDLAVVAGGQLFMNGYALLLEECLRLLEDTPVIFHALGMGPLCPAIEKRLHTLLKSSHVAAVSTREQTELPGAVRILDPALDAAGLLHISRKPSDTLGLGVMYPNGVPYGRALKQWRELLRELDRRGVRWQLFTNGDPADEVFARRVLHSFPDLEERIAPRCVTPEELLQTLSGYRGILSYRLHSLIPAVSLGIPAVGIAWDGKLRAFFDAIGCPERCFSVHASAQELLAGLEKAEKQGYDAALLERYCRESEKWLLDAVSREVGG